MHIEMSNHISKEQHVDCW